ncbi:Circumsporozoite protein [Amphibalanus amphitrite]|uniref:Circumsporozoite protein n=1 Tax=Amphibalanus amphitrite TaxID=1232801 RepID=A0A6A4X9Z8_AMPAM|nr:Circumsporozoite protein [Amphibalanus amphitrite]
MFALFWQKRLVCQHYARQKPGKTCKASPRDTGCPVTLDIRVRKVTFQKNAKSRSKKPDAGYALQVKARGQHNHPLETATVLKFRRVSDRTRERIIDLFRHHHSPATALRTLKLQLQAEHGERYPLIAADRGILPDTNYFYNVDQQPSVGSVDQQPSAGSVDQQPSAGSVDQQPSAGSVDQQPSAGSVDQQPSAGSVDQQPSAVNQQLSADSVNQQPSVGSVDQQPSAGSVVNQQPSAGSVDQQPSAVPDDGDDTAYHDGDDTACDDGEMEETDGDLEPSASPSGPDDHLQTMRDEIKARLDSFTRRVLKSAVTSDEVEDWHRAVVAFDTKFSKMSKAARKLAFYNFGASPGGGRSGTRTAGKPTSTARRTSATVEPECVPAGQWAAVNTSTPAQRVVAEPQSLSTVWIQIADFETDDTSGDALSITSDLCVCCRWSSNRGVGPTIDSRSAVAGARRAGWPLRQQGDLLVTEAPGGYPLLLRDQDAPAGHGPVRRWSLACSDLERSVALWRGASPAGHDPVRRWSLACSDLERSVAHWRSAPPAGHCSRSVATRRD